MNAIVNAIELARWYNVGIRNNQRDFIHCHNVVMCIQCNYVVATSQPLATHKIIWFNEWSGCAYLCKS